MSKIYFYFHAGSGNHGCEAIVRGICKILKNVTNKAVYSFSKHEDLTFKLDKEINVCELGPQDYHIKVYHKLHFLTKFIPQKIKSFIKQIRNNKKTVKDETDFFERKYKSLFLSLADVYISIGGDNYCYGKQSLEPLNFLNTKINNLNKKTILFGCSIEPKDIIENESLREDLKKYSLITARESLTYDALIENGINKNTHLFPDPAFLLDKEVPNDLPNNFIPNNTIGLNLSPMVQEFQKGKNTIYKNFVELMIDIIKNTNMNISLIPHVIWENNNDFEPLTKLYKQFKNTNRVCLIDKSYNACQLKGIISQCRFMIASRTHASIAAYSTQVPTLVIGYSVKAKGIAKDIFGDYKDYVLPVQDLKEKREVLNVLKKLMQNETKIREHYKIFMPKYIERTWLASKEVEKVLNN